MARPRAQQRQPQPAPPGSLPRLNANAAGIDVGATSHFVAVPAGRDTCSVREFTTFTGEGHLVDEQPLFTGGVVTIDKSALAGLHENEFPLHDQVVSFP